MNLKKLHNDIHEGALQLLAEHREQLFAKARTLCDSDDEADELVIRTIDQAIRKIDTYAGEGDILAWMKSILVNLHSNDYRNPVVRGTMAVESDELERHAGAEWSTDEQLLKNSDSEAIRKALSELDPKYHQVLLMRYYDGFSLKQIASFLRIPQGTVSWRLHVAHRLLAGKLEVLLGRAKKPLAVLAAALTLVSAATAAVATVPALAPVRDAVVAWFEDGDADPSGTGVPPVQVAEEDPSGTGVSPVQTGQVQDNLTKQNTQFTERENTMNMKRIAAMTGAAMLGLSAVSAESYTAVDYITTSSTAKNWVLLDYVPVENTIIEMTAEIPQSGVGKTQALFCARGTTAKENTYSGFMVYSSKKNTLRFDFSSNGTGKAGGSLIRDVKYVFTFDPSVGLKVLGGNSVYDTSSSYATSSTVCETTPIPGFTAGNKLVLFASYTGATDVAPTATDDFADFRVYRVRIWEGSKTDSDLKIDLKPCVNGDGVPGFRDAANGDRFYGCSGESPFGYSATLVWTGGGDNDNFSNPDNWEPAWAPISGDSLTFAGETRTTPYNDLDPDSYAFDYIRFTNNGSAGKNAAFTLSGNTLNVSRSILAAEVSGGSLTETFDLEVAAMQKLEIGGTASKMTMHHFVFNKKVTGPTTARLQNTTEHAGTIRFVGDIVGFGDYYRPNGGASIYLLGNNTAFTGTTGIHWGSGNLFVVDASNFGSAPCFGSGQSKYSTAGKLSVAPTNDVVLTAKLNVTGPQQTNNGLTVENTKVGPLLTIAGEVALSGTKDNVGSRLTIQGDGNGVFTGKFSAKNMAIQKNGAGAWTLSQDIPSFAPTGLVEIAAGTLCIDCVTPTYVASVAKNATLTGSGSLGTAAFPATVTFASGAKYEVRTLADSSVSALAVTGTVSLAGDVKVNLTGAAELQPGTSTLLMNYSARTGAGSFSVGTGFPSDTILRVTDTALYADVPTDTKTWSGTASAEWNKTDANWGGSVYEDGTPVVFPDIADASKRNVTVPDTVKPMTVTVAAQEDRPYSFTGDGKVEGVQLIEFTGTATNTWAVALSDITLIQVSNGELILNGPVENATVTVKSGGALELDGTFTDSSLLVERGGAFTQTASSSVLGNSSLVFLNASSTLYGTNDFTGSLAVGQNQGTFSSSPSCTLAVRAPLSLGGGGDFALYSSTLACYADVAVTNRLLQMQGYNNYCKVAVSSGRTFEWAGDIDIHGKPYAEMFSGNGSTVILGKRDGTSAIRVLDDRALTFAEATVHLYANCQSASEVGFRGTLYLYSSKNDWSMLGINAGTCHTMADNVLPADKPLNMLQKYSTVAYGATLNLNGTSQTVSKIVLDYNPALANVSTFTSANPATLTVKNAEDFAYSDLDTFFVKGAVTLCKKGSAKWTLGVQNTSSGNLEVREGTLAITDARSFPTGKKSVFRIADGATLELADGVAGEIAYGARIVGGRELVLEPGVYGGPDCTVAGVQKVGWIAGAGTLRVRKMLNGGLILFVY